MSVTSTHSQNSISPGAVPDAPGTHSAQPQTEAAGVDLRVRFARACDRCRWVISIVHYCKLTGPTDTGK